MPGVPGLLCLFVENPTNHTPIFKGGVVSDHSNHILLRYYSVEPSKVLLDKIKQELLDGLKEVSEGNGNGSPKSMKVRLPNGLGEIRAKVIRERMLRAMFFSPLEVKEEENNNKKIVPIASRDYERLKDVLVDPKQKDDLVDFLTYGLRLLNALEIIKGVALGSSDDYTANNPMMIKLPHGQLNLYREGSLVTVESYKRTKDGQLADWHTDLDYWPLTFDEEGCLLVDEVGCCNFLVAPMKYSDPNKPVTTKIELYGRTCYNPNYE